MRFNDISSLFQLFFKKSMLINFTKLTEKQSYRSLFFDTILGLKFKKDSRTTAGRIFLLNTLYSLRQPQPQNVLDLSPWPWLFSDDKLQNFQNKYCQSLQVRINKIEFANLIRLPTAQKMKFFIKALFSKCDQIRRKLFLCSDHERMGWLQRKITVTSSVE